MRSSMIAGVGEYLPGEAVTNAQLERRAGRLVAWVCEMLGSQTRHFACDLDTGRLREGESNAHMAFRAATRALEHAGRMASDVDLIILSTSTPDYPFPATVYFVQEMLEIPSCAAMELRAGCAGMAQALCVADSFIRSGRCRTALVIGSELMSPFGIELLTFPDLEDKEGLLNLAMFGDGAGALVLTATDGEPGQIDCFFTSIGPGRLPGMMLVAGGAQLPAGSKNGIAHPARVKHDFAQILEHGPSLLLAAAREAETRTGIPLPEYKFIVPPQVNSRLILETVRRIGVDPGRVFMDYTRVGNTSSAGIYLALHRLCNHERLVRSGDLLLLLPSETTKWIYGGAVVRWLR